MLFAGATDFDEGGTSDKLAMASTERRYQTNMKFTDFMEFNIVVLVDVAGIRPRLAITRFKSGYAERL